MNEEEARLYFAEHGKDPNINHVMNDIMACHPRQVSRQLDIDDLHAIHPGLNFPLRDEYHIDVRAARIMVEQFITMNPCFRSTNPKNVRKSIEYYFEKHPEEKLGKPIKHPAQKTFEKYVEQQIKNNNEVH